MINIFGKSLVVANVVLSLMALSVAGAIYLDFTDLGWVTPRRELDQSIASDYDKSVASIDVALTSRNHALPLVKPVQETLAETEVAFPKNHLFYVATLKGLASSTDKDFTVAALQEPLFPLDIPNKEIGKPVFEGKVDGLVKSVSSYEADLAELIGKTAPDDPTKFLSEGKIAKVQDDIRKVNKQIGDTGYILTGKDAAGVQDTFGLYDLIEAEYKALTAAKEELAEVKPRWGEVLEEARLFALRRNSLTATLKRLDDAQLGPRKGK